MLQSTLQRFLLSTLKDRSQSDDDFLRPAGDPGLFGPDSAIWQVHDDASMLVGGISALHLQTLHPLAMAGVSDHSDFRTDPLGRLQRTASFVVTTTYGSTSAAEKAIAVVNRLHEHVHGKTPDGRPYDATDPDLAVWVHATEIASFLRAVRHYGPRHIDDAMADRYIDEAALVAEKLGAMNVPHSLAEMDAYFEKVRPELELGDQAKDCLHFLAQPPIPLYQKRLHLVLARGAVDLLPEWARALMGVPAPSRWQRASNDALVRGALSTMRWGLSTAAGPPDMARARVGSAGRLGRDERNASARSRSGERVQHRGTG